MTTALAMAAIVGLGVGGAIAAERSIRFTIFDAGIMQPWTEDMRAGEDYRPGHHRLSDDPSVRKILFPMPSDADFRRYNDEALTAQMAADLQRRIGRDLARGATDFEIQLVEHISRLGYVDADRQKLVQRFGAIAYAAIGNVKSAITKGPTTVDVHVVAGSNGTAMFTRNIAAWADYARDIRSVTLVDGRATVTDVRRTFSFIDPARVSIVNTRGDLPAPAGSIAQHDEARRLQRTAPTMSVVWLHPIDRGARLSNGAKPSINHIIGITAPDARHRVRSFDARGNVRDLGTVGGRDIMRWAAGRTPTIGAPSGDRARGGISIDVRPEPMDPGALPDLKIAPGQVQPSPSMGRQP